MTSPNPRSIVAVLLAITVCLTILLPIVARLFGAVEQLPEQVIAGLARLIDVIAGGVIVWLAGKESTP